MKYYSEKLSKVYDTAEECQQAERIAEEKEARARLEKERKEKELKEKKEKEAAERKAAAQNVDEARKAYTEAQKAYREALESFCQRYGTYHYSIENGEEVPTLFDWFGNLLKF